MYKYLKTADQLEQFQARQDGYATLLRPFLKPDLNPYSSDDDLAWLRNKVSEVEEAVGAAGGDKKTADLVLRTIHAGLQKHRETFGFYPSDDQLAAMGSNLKYFADSTEPGAIQEIVESVDNAGTFSRDLPVLPHFMTMAVLIPLMQISPNFCYSIGNAGHDRIAVYELDEQVGKNPYGVPEGTSINGLYDGRLAETRRRYDMARTYDGGADETTYTLTTPYPVVKSNVMVMVNKRKVAEDDGSGNLQIINGGAYNGDGDKIVMASSSVDYWDEGAGEATVQIKLSGDFDASIPVWGRVDTDVENYPNFVSETQYRTRSFELTSEADEIRTGMTFQAILKGMRNMSLNIKDIAFSRLMTIAAADGDKKVLRDLYDFAEGEQVFSMNVSEYRDPYEQWQRIREPMNELSDIMQSRTEGKAGVKAWIGGRKLRLWAQNMEGRGVKLAATVKNPLLANQPHYLGEFDGYQLYFAPNYPTDTTNPANVTEKIIGVGRGDSVSACAVVLGAVTPPILKRHAVGLDLASRATLYGESVRDTPPEAYNYVTVLEIQNL